LSSYPPTYNEIIAADEDGITVAPFHRFLEPAEDDARNAVYISGSVRKVSMMEDFQEPSPQHRKQGQIESGAAVQRLTLVRILDPKVVS
jgi:hypothetical protein